MPEAQNNLEDNTLYLPSPVPCTSKNELSGMFVALLRTEEYCKKIEYWSKLVVAL